MSEEDFSYADDTPNVKHIDQSDGDDPYESLPEGPTADNGWRYNKESDEFHLKNWFSLPAQQYNSLF